VVYEQTSPCKPSSPPADPSQNTGSCFPVYWAQYNPSNPAPYSAPLWLEWWWTTPAGTPEQLRVNLDSAAPDFYDYTTAAWYTSAQHGGGQQATGPYVDYFCTGEYTITLSVPVLAGGRFLGVAAADVLVASLEKLIMPGLLGQDGPVALASQDGRLIAATSAAVPPDLRVPADSGELPSPLLHWRLARLGTAR
jgi:hypothetical protein